MSSQLLQVGTQALALAQTRVQTKVGEAPIFIIGVAIAGFGLSVVAIFMTALLMKPDIVVKADAGQELPNAAALLTQRLRGMGAAKTPKSLGASQSYFGQPWGEQQWQSRGIPQLPSPPDAPQSMGANYFQGQPCQIVVPQPLEFGKVGLILNDSDLVISGFQDSRAAAFGFEVGDRVTQINGVTVQHEEDFKYVLQDAVWRNSTQGTPIVFNVLRNSAGLPGTQPRMQPQAEVTPPEASDICGKWCYGKGDKVSDYYYTITRVGASLRFEQELPDGKKVSGVLAPDKPNSPWLWSKLYMSSGEHFGDIRLTYDKDDKAISSQLKPAGKKKWGEELIARKDGAVQPTVPQTLLPTAPDSPAPYAAPPSMTAAGTVPETMVPVYAASTSRAGNPSLETMLPATHPASPQASYAASTSRAGNPSLETMLPATHPASPQASYAASPSVLVGAAPAASLPVTSVAAPHASYASSPAVQVGAAPVPETMLPVAPTAAPQDSYAASPSMMAFMAAAAKQPSQAASTRVVATAAPPSMSPMPPATTSQVSFAPTGMPQAQPSLTPAMQKPVSAAEADVAKQALDLFDKLDKDQSGAISRKEFEEGLMAASAAPAADAGLLPVATQQPQDSYANSPSLMAAINAQR